MESKNILIAEDESIIALELTETLSNLGYNVSETVNAGEKALEKVKVDPPDLVLMDIRLKGEMDGIETAAKIRSEYDIPIVFLTAYLDDERLSKAKLTMPFGYLLKPVKERELKVTIEMACYVAQVDAKRKHAEDTAKKNAEKFKLLYERAPLSYQSLDADGCFIEVNNSWLNQLGYTREEVIGRNFAEFIHPDWQDHFKENFPRFKSLGEVIGVEFEMVKKDGSMILVSFDGRIGLNEKGEFQQTHCIFKDIGEQKKYEASLIEAEAKWKAVLDNFPEQTLVIDLEGRVEYINFTFETEKEQLIGRSIFNILDDEAGLVVKEHMQKALETGSKQVYRVKHIFPSGKEIPFESHLGPIKQSMQITGFTITNRPLDPSEK